MRNEEMNKNEILEDEVLNENELSALNETLKANENIELPEKLSKESIEALLKKEANKIEYLEKENKKIERENKSLFKKMIAIAAVFAIVATSMFFVKPWQYINQKEEQISVEDSGVTTAQDYSEIEALFVNYQKNYNSKKYFGLVGGGADDEGLVLEDGAVMNGAATDTAAPGTTDRYYGTELFEEVIDKSETSSETTPYAQEHGETNEQVAGVNEADIIKNDGKHLYVVPKQKMYWEYQDFMQSKIKSTEPVTGYTANGNVYVSPGYNPQEEIYKNMTEEDFINKIFIVEAGKNGALKKVGEIKTGEHENEKINFSKVTEIFVDGNRLIAVLNCYSYYGEENPEEAEDRYYKTSKIVTCAVCYDITDRGNPKEEWRVYQDGDYVSARKTGNKIVLVSNYNVPLYFEDADIRDICIPEVYAGETACKIAADDICIMGKVSSSSYAVVSTLDVTNKETFNSTAVLGGGEQVYCTQKNLYVVSGKWEEVVSESVERAAEIFMIDVDTLYTTEILKFDISGEKIKYETKGRVKGRTLNQFSIDEYKGYLRIATTVGDFREEKNNVYVLDKNMTVVGALEGLAKGETIKSVRFMGDTGYVVTFEQTDPLFVIDLTSPEAPVVLGELKIPGFSNYLHPVSENYLLGIGVNGDNNGAKNGMKVSLFDVSDKKNPKEVAKFEVEPQENSENLWAYLECPAFTSHKAVCWDSKNLTMYIPYSITTEYMHTEDNSYRSEFHTTHNVIALKVDTVNGKLQNVNNYVVGSYDEGFSGGGASRVTYIGNTVYSFSQSSSEICSFDKSSAAKLSTINLQ